MLADGVGGRAVARAGHGRLGGPGHALRAIRPRGRADRSTPGSATQGEAVRRALDDLGVASAPAGARPAAVGHRIVPRRRAHARRSGSRPRPRRASPSSPSSRRCTTSPGLEALAAAEALVPDVPHVAVFDTAFHATLPPAARTYPLPHAWTERWGIRRYGFHGLSHAYCTTARRGAGRAPGRASCASSSATSATAARRGGAARPSVDTTMGFTPLDGLMMATRSGSVDPGDPDARAAPAHGSAPTRSTTRSTSASGLLGVSGISGDMREVLAAGPRRRRARAAGDRRSTSTACARRSARWRRRSAGRCAGVHRAASARTRRRSARRAASGLECLGSSSTPAANARCRPDADVATRRRACASS